MESTNTRTSTRPAPTVVDAGQPISLSSLDAGQRATAQGLEGALLVALDRAQTQALDAARDAQSFAQQIALGAQKALGEQSAALRVMAGGAVRHQFSIGELARQCRVINKQLVLKVGVEGKALLGPAGSPSAFTVPVTIAVRKDGEERPFLARSYRATAAIPAGQSQTTFTIVSDEIIVPFVSEAANEDYEIIVSIDGAGAGAR